ncbi:MAG: ABC transporter permease subunit [Chloroflexi bacterium]|nr:ABC transporter permease subunit [Chloroflexota bacterium]
MKLLDNRRLLSLILAGAFLWSLASIDWRGPLVHTGGASALVNFLAALFPPELSPEFLGLALVASWQTLTYAVAGITLAVLIGFPLGVLASGAVTNSPHIGFKLAVGVRLLLAGLRSIHELVWAVLFVAAFGLSSLTAILALALPYAGILGRIYGEQFNQMPEEPLRALRASGASPFRVFLYGRLPMALPDLVSYTFYRFECGIRSAAIMSFVGIRGLGFEIQISLQDLLFNQVWTLILFLVAMVVLVDLWSARVRRSLVS